MDEIFFQIGDTVVKTPKEYTISQHTIDADSTGRNANGEMIRDVVAQKTKLSCVWGPMTIIELQTILNLIQSPFFQITYIDSEIGIMTTKTFYCGDRDATSYSWHPNFRNIIWKDTRVNFIER